VEHDASQTDSYEYAWVYSVDRERVSKLIEELRESLRVAEEIVSLGLNEFLADIRNRYTLRLSIVEIVEAATLIGLHILREQFNDTAEGYVQVFRKLLEHGILSRDTGEGMIKLARLRNLIVHRYWDIDDARVYTEIKEVGIELVKKFIREVEEHASRA